MCRDKNNKNGVRLLIISSDKFPPFRVDVRVLFGKELCSRGYRIDWILQAQDDCDTPYVTDWHCGRVLVGATDNGTTFLARLRKHILGISNDLRIFSMMRNNKYDCIQVKDKFISALVAIYASRLYRIKFVYWLSFPFPESSIAAVKRGTARYPLLYAIRGVVQKFLLYRIILRKADHIFVQSEQMKLDISQKGIDEEKITPVPMGVALEEIERVRESRLDASAHGNRRIVYLGTLARGRRLDYLIRAIAKVLQQITDVELVLIGDGNESDISVLRSEIETHGLQDKVTFTGFLPIAEAWRHVAEAEICVSPFFPTPQLNAASPTKLIEYMALEKPVVATHHPEQTRIVSESGGGLCVAYDEEAFADAFLWLLRHPSEAREMGLRGRTFVEKFRSYATIADRVDATYQSILGRR